MPRTRNLPSLTGLRFLAAFVVFGTHAWWRIEEGPVKSALGVLFVNGFAGVSFFFVLSGFILVWSRREGDTPRAFYRRRVARVLPAYLLGLVLALAWNIAQSPGSAGSQLAASLPSFMLVQSWVPIEHVYYGGNLPGWSLADEAFFYLLFPALVAFMAAARRRWIAIIVALAIMLIVPLALAPESRDGLAYWAIYVLPATRIAEFTLGLGLALAMRGGWRFPLSPWAALSIAVVAYFALPFVPLGLRLVAVMAIPFVLVVGSFAQADLDGKRTIFSSSIASHLGAWSYAIYLVHFTVLGVVFWLFAVVLGERAFGQSTMWGLVAICVALAASIGAAALVYRWLEAPLERRLRSPRARRGAPIEDAERLPS